MASGSRARGQGSAVSGADARDTLINPDLAHLHRDGRSGSDVAEVELVVAVLKRKLAEADARIRAAQAEARVFADTIRALKPSVANAEALARDRTVAGADALDTLVNPGLDHLHRDGRSGSDDVAENALVVDVLERKLQRGAAEAEARTFAETIRALNPRVANAEAPDLSLQLDDLRSRSSAAKAPSAGDAAHLASQLNNPTALARERQAERLIREGNERIHSLLDEIKACEYSAVEAEAKIRAAAETEAALRAKIHSLQLSAMNLISAMSGAGADLMQPAAGPSREPQVLPQSQHFTTANTDGVGCSREATGIQQTTIAQGQVGSGDVPMTPRYTAAMWSRPAPHLVMALSKRHEALSRAAPQFAAAPLPSDVLIDDDNAEALEQRKRDSLGHDSGGISGGKRAVVREDNHQQKENKPLKKKPKPAGAFVVASEDSGSNNQAEETEEELSKKLDIIKAQVAAWEGTIYGVVDAAQVTLQAATPPPAEEVQTVISGVHTVVPTEAPKTARRQKGVSFYDEVFKSEMEKRKLIAGNEENEESLKKKAADAASKALYERCFSQAPYLPAQLGSQTVEEDSDEEA